MILETVFQKNTLNIINNRNENKKILFFIEYTKIKKRYKKHLSIFNKTKK